METIDDIIVLKIKQIDSKLGIAMATQELPPGGFGGRVDAASILAPL